MSFDNLLIDRISRTAGCVVKDVISKIQASLNIPDNTLGQIRSTVVTSVKNLDHPDESATLGILYAIGRLNNLNMTLSFSDSENRNAAQFSFGTISLDDKQIDEQKQTETSDRIDVEFNAVTAALCKVLPEDVDPRLVREASRSFVTKLLNMENEEKDGRVPVAHMGKAMRMVKEMTRTDTPKRVNGTSAMTATSFEEYRDTDGILYEYQLSNGGCSLYLITK